MTTLMFGVWFVQGCVFSQWVVNTLVGEQEQLSKLEENGE